MMEGKRHGTAEPPEGAQRVVTVDLPGGRGYDIYIGPGLVHRAAALLPFDPAGRGAFIVTDANAAPYARSLVVALEQAGAWPVHTLTLPPGEGTKSWAQLRAIVDWLLERRVRRGTPLFAVGGGVVGDIAGFAAAVTLRGLPYIQVPTTLLAQVDSAVGGKTGLNVPEGKNLVGAFHQPAAVIADTDALATLPPREVAAGYAEVLKYALIGDPALFDWLEAHGGEVLAAAPGPLGHAVAASCRAKAEIVAADEREEGRRALLNFGHTFGHALEAACGYDGRLLHGEAVAIGMALALDVSVRMGPCPEADRERALAHMDALGLPTRAADLEGLGADADALLALMEGDKKAAADGTARLVLLEGIGRAFVTSDVPPEVLHAAWAGSLG
jgi:3-dehydroquinate synthase